MSITRKLTLLVGLAVAGLAMTSCNKTAEYDLQAINDVSLQLSSFEINSADNTSLSSYFFSINNSSGVGEISNQIPLPYGTELKDVTLSISPLTGSYQANVNTVQVAVGNESAEEWNATKKYTIPADTELSIIITNKVDVTQSYTYKVKINQYKYDPETISWTSVNTSSTALFTDNLPAFTFVAPSNQQRYFVKQGTQSFYQLSETGAPSPASFSGFVSGENVKRVVSNDDSVYALGTLGNLYKLEGTSWTALANRDAVYELLGILPAYGAETSASLAVLLTPDRSMTINTSLDADKRAVYAVYTNGAINTKEYYAPASFPGLKSSDSFVTFAQTANYMGASLELIGASTSAELGKSYRSTWFTTNGTKWASDSTPLLDMSMPSAMSVVKSGSLYYRLETGAQGLSVYYSADKKNWTKSGDVALGGLDQAAMQQASFVAWSNGDYIYILQGTNTTTTLWQGKIKRSATE